MGRVYRKYQGEGHAADRKVREQSRNSATRNSVFAHARDRSSTERKRNGFFKVVSAVPVPVR